MTEDLMSYEEKQLERQISGVLKAVGVFILIVILLLINPFVVVGAGKRGVVFSKATGVKSEPLTEGIHVRAPLVESVHTIDVRTRSSRLDELIAGSKDNNQTVTYKVTANWHIDPSQVALFYQQVGTDNEKDITTRFINTSVQQGVKTAQASFNAEETIARQGEIKALAEANTRPELAKYHIILDSIVFEDQDFTAQYNKALEDRAQARIQADQATFLKQKAQNEADANLVTASASAKVAVLEAQGKAQAQQLLQQTLTPELLQKMAIEKWDGHYPQTVLGGDSVPLISLK